jgi:predicted transposase/invertase (TIGR01784 family)
MNGKLIRFDWAMKTILRDKANFDVLEGFLCALFDDDDIKILNILESEANQTTESDKFNRVDLLIQDSQNRKIYIEIQNTRETDYLESLLYGTSKIIVENQKLGEDFKNISKVISISILYFNLGTGDDYIYYGTTDFKGLNTGTNLIIKKRIETIESFKPKYKFIEKKIFPEYYLITVERYQNIIKRKIDEWIYIIKNSEVAEGSKSKNIDKAKQKLSELNMTSEERKRYEKFLINTARDRDAINTAKEEGLELGKKIGIIEGIIEGKEKGIIEGKEKGIIEGKEKGIIETKEEIALEMIKDNESNEKIKKFTGLSEIKINEMRKLYSK